MLAPPRTSGETGVTVGRRLAALGSSGGRGAGSSTSTRVVQPQGGAAPSSARVSLLPVPPSLVNKCGGTQLP